MERTSGSPRPPFLMIAPRGAPISRNTKQEKAMVNFRWVSISNLLKRLIFDSIEIVEGETIVLSPVVTDLNGDDVKVTISEPVGDNGVWETGYTDNGEYIITVSANDGETTTSQEIVVIVNDVNVAPVIEDIVQG